MDSVDRKGPAFAKNLGGSRTQQKANEIFILRRVCKQFFYSINYLIPSKNVIKKCLQLGIHVWKLFKVIIILS